MRHLFLLLAVSLLLCGCGGNRQPTGPERHYQLTGRVVALNPANHTATIDAAAIPNFMEAMTMEYPIRSRAEFQKLHTGDKITATVNVSDDGYNLSNIHTDTAGK
ncbi:MAG TPA: copper-binding protein [Bryobacteraceae bacterium]|nr:copper-binding protein [Bryobacteraceae bacterium]